MASRTVFAIITAFALVQLGLGVGLIFAPEEAAGLLFGAAPLPPVVLALVGAALFGFGQLNWLTRRMPIGGIYGRPVVMANLVHGLVGGLALVRVADTPGLWVLTAVYLAAAVFYGLLLVTAPKAAPPASAGTLTR